MNINNNRKYKKIRNEAIKDSVKELIGEDNNTNVNTTTKTATLTLELLKNVYSTLHSKNNLSEYIATIRHLDSTMASLKQKKH
jgi:metal-responsive CopG/Arc/MetJ family transcriptional regulator